jgi:hypothetical protein
MFFHIAKYTVLHTAHRHGDGRQSMETNACLQTSTDGRANDALISGVGASRSVDVFHGHHICRHKQRLMTVIILLIFLKLVYLRSLPQQRLCRLLNMCQVCNHNSPQPSRPRDMQLHTESMIREKIKEENDSHTFMDKIFVLARTLVLHVGNRNLFLCQQSPQFVLNQGIVTHLKDLLFCRSSCNL